MSKNKKHEQVQQENVEETKNEEQENNVEVDSKKEVESNTEEEIQVEAKRIADMEAKIISLENENKLLKEFKENCKNEFNNKLAIMEKSYQDLYKDQMYLKEKQAQEQIKAKLEELQTKAKNELIEAKKYAIKDQAMELINIITQFDKACSFPLSDPKLINYQRGFQIFVVQFNNLLNDLGITKIVPEIGSEFDPNTMECFSETVKDETKKDNSIVEIIYPGYKLHDRLLQPATVKVIKNN